MSRITRKHLLSMTDTLIKANKALKMSLPQGAKKEGSSDSAAVRLPGQCYFHRRNNGEAIW